MIIFTLRRSIFYLFVVICYTVVFAFTTITPFVSQTTSSLSSRGCNNNHNNNNKRTTILLFSVDRSSPSPPSHDDDDDDDDDDDHIVLYGSELLRQSIINAKTTREIHTIFLDAIKRNNKERQNGNENGIKNENNEDINYVRVCNESMPYQNDTPLWGLNNEQLPSPPPPSLDNDKKTMLLLEMEQDEEESIISTKNLSHFNLDVTGSALRRMAYLSRKETRMDEPDDPEYRLIRNSLLTSLLQTIGEQVVIAHRSSDNNNNNNNYNSSLLCIDGLADTLLGLAALAKRQKKATATQNNMQPLAKLVVDLLERHNVNDISKQLGPVKLLQCFSAISLLQLVNEDHHDDHHRPLLLDSIYTRLLKPDAVSKLSAEKISNGLSTLACMKSKRSKNNKQRFLLARSFMRRLRKQKVRDEATIVDLYRSLIACDTLLVDGCMEGNEDEASIFGFSTLRTIVNKSSEQSYKFTPKQMSNILSAWATLSTGEREDTVIIDLLSICNQQKIIDSCNLIQLATILTSIEKLHVTSSSKTIKAAGNRLATLVRERRQSKNHNKEFDPTIISQILRCPVLLNRRNALVMEPYLIASSELFVDEQFLENCRVSTLANFLWFMSMSNSNDYEALTALANRLLEPSLVDACSPKLASRIIGTYTSILSHTATTTTTKLSSSNGNNNNGDDDDDIVRSTPLSPSGLQMTSKLFHEYGGHLLTTQLTPAEVSTSLYSYAKVSYVEDMGIYDYLVSLLVSMADECTSRQLTQSLWSCGKMIGFESTDYGADHPPYFDHAYNIAMILSSRLQRDDDDNQSKLSHVDVTQCIWALGRLGVDDSSIVTAFVDRAKEQVDVLNAVEISNILWGLAKIGFISADDSSDDDGAFAQFVSSLSHRLSSDETLNVTPKAAATALYAMGKLRLRDEEVFNKLSQIIISQIENASAQAVANALWAHKRVQLRPPKEMLNLWAIQKLGLTGLQFHSPNAEE